MWSFVFLLGSLFVLGDACPPIVSRAGWSARPARSTAAVLPRGLRFAAIHHGGSNAFCTTQAACANLVRAYQNWHMDNNRWPDIGYNFVIGESGHIFQGRGWGGVGAHALNWNTRSIGIAIIGDFTRRAPNAAALNALRALLRCGVSNGRLASNYQLVGHRQLGSTSCPGNQLFNEISRWPHFSRNPRSFDEVNLETVTPDDEVNLETVTPDDEVNLETITPDDLLEDGQ